MTPLLDIQDLYSGYRGVDILKGIHLKVNPGQIVVIIGPNGAGKSTVLKSLFGLATIRSGRVLFQGSDITHLPAEQLVQRGIGFVPQTNNVFPSLTVQENLEMGAFIRRDNPAAQLERVYELFPPLKEKRRQAAGSLSGGQRQMLAIGRALMVEPQLLLLDEPTAGLSPLYIEQTFALLQEINRLGISILMVEQNAKQALKMADWGYVLSTGENRFEDTGPNLLNNPEVLELFLGG
ncbi:ABC transporter ATP-binding protein [Synechococcus sp. JA-2-3B'a(2-13)]|jgi:ABC-type branched-subunit amino acid transport system ATPase component|uniref:ABC transporter ATP-binding protein n=1 Tax=Synechococcus sp. (strain JA-2-3B'a(2-13)) TaxID=321332 RepID=UPI0000694C53|nr:ABC transporter ATP-binding protein [Synechococcus sp. JA-2-3B'a(2-13)]ABD01758.1 hydrophobic amino acid ABC transporter (HAAT) family, ATP-binding protein [Synechococcus sp. JA-2-3B'a(2-13)]